LLLDTILVTSCYATFNQSVERETLLLIDYLLPPLPDTSPYRKRKRRRKEGNTEMKRKALLLLTAMAFTLVLAGGVALAATFACTTNPCNGTSGDDDIFGDDVAETINALEGNDHVDGLLGDDTIFGGPGSDANEGGGGTRGLVGAEDSDRVFGEHGDDFIDLATLDTPGSEDFASGGPGNDTIHAFDGKQDIIDCGKGRTDHVFYDKGLDTVSRNCEKKHPNVAPASVASASVASAAADADESQRRPTPPAPAE
jgi:hypothetical protein